jgi:transcriptional regulator with XRE-family HTH domain
VKRSDKQLGMILRMCRQEAGLSQEQLSQYLLCDRSHISRIESGQDIPDAIELITWAKVTDSQKFIAIYLIGEDNWQKAIEELKTFEQIRHMILDPIA